MTHSTVTQPDGVPEFAGALADAPEHHRQALELAWESYRQGSMPVGAVLIDRSNDTVVATGRDRTRDVGRDRRGVAGTDLAHAEMVALLDLGGARPRLKLVSTIEPCPMCATSLALYRVRAVRYLTPDPYDGAGRLPDFTCHLAERDLAITPAAPSPLTELAGALVVEHMLRSGRHGGAVEAWQASGVDAGYRLGARLFTRGRLDALARTGASLAEVADAAERVWRER